MVDVPSVAAVFGAAAVETFLGLPSCPDLERLDAGIAILGVPCATPYPAAGAYCAGAPAAIRAAIAPYAANLEHFDFDLGGPIFPDGVRAVDCGDLDGDVTDPAGNRARIRAGVATILSKGAVPVVLGGDDSIPIPMLAGFEGQGPFTILQIDAHLNWRDEVGGERFGLSSTMRRASEMTHIGGLVQVGARAIGSARPGDVEDARRYGAKLVLAQEVHRHGITPVLDLIPAGADVIVTLDCDGLDPAIMPAVLGPAPGGLTYWQVVELLHGVAAKARIAGFDLVEFLPERDINQQGALVAARIITNVLGLLARN